MEACTRSRHRPRPPCPQTLLRPHPGPSACRVVRSNRNGRQRRARKRLSRFFRATLKWQNLNFIQHQIFVATAVEFPQFFFSHHRFGSETTRNAIEGTVPQTAVSGTVPHKGKSGGRLGSWRRRESPARHCPGHRRFRYLVPPPPPIPLVFVCKAPDCFHVSNVEICTDAVGLKRSPLEVWFAMRRVWSGGKSFIGTVQATAVLLNLVQSTN